MIAILISLIIAVMPIHHIEEDEPGWDCTTMGNHQCGAPNNPLGIEEDEPGWDCRTMGNLRCAE